MEEYRAAECKLAKGRFTVQLTAVVACSRLRCWCDHSSANQPSGGHADAMADSSTVGVDGRRGNGSRRLRRYPVVSSGEHRGYIPIFCRVSTSLEKACLPCRGEHAERCNCPPTIARSQLIDTVRLGELHWHFRTGSPRCMSFKETPYSLTILHSGLINCPLGRYSAAQLQRPQCARRCAPS